MRDEAELVLKELVYHPEEHNKLYPGEKGTMK